MHHAMLSRGVAALLAAAGAWCSLAAWRMGLWMDGVPGAGLLPFVSRYRLVPLGALAAQWPADDLSLTIDGSSEHRLTLTSEGVRTLLAR